MNASHIREAGRIVALRRIVAGVTEEWGRGLVEMVDEMKARGEVRGDVDASSLLRGVLALRDGLYSHIILGAGRYEARRAWVYVMSLLMDAVMA